MSLAQVAIPEAAPEAAPLDLSYLDSLSVGLGIPEEAPPPEGQTEETPPPPDPVVPATPEPVKPHRPEAAKRIEEKNFKKRVEELEKELEELRPLRTKKEELETSLTEYRTLAEQKEAERKALEEAYRNEAAKVPDEVIYELPQVREANDNFMKRGAALFPRDLSDPNSDEAVRTFDPATLTDAKRQQIVEKINLWEQHEANAEMDPDIKADIQHILVSQMAMIAGVKPERFVPKVVGGREYQVLPPSHPVYQHLSRSVEPFVGARRAFTQAREEALAKAAETLGTAVSQRTTAAKREWSEHGIGLTGEALATALSKNPDSPTLKTMKVLEAHPDLVAELQQQAELEALASGHLRAQLDLVESDPKERTAKATALQNRLRQRALNAPLVEPLKKLVLRMAEEKEALLKRVAEAEAEASRTRIQSEAGGVASGGGDLTEAPIDDHYAHIAKRLKIA